MSILLKASFVYFGIEEETIVIGFADDEFDPKNYVLLQKSLFIDDIAMLNKVHITLNSDNRAAYGGIVRIILSQKLISIILAKETASLLGVGDAIEIEYTLDEKNFNSFISHFHKLNVEEEMVIEVQ